MIAGLIFHIPDMHLYSGVRRAVSRALLNGARAPSVVDNLYIKEYRREVGSYLYG
jgi:hypothetical protein